MARDKFKAIQHTRSVEDEELDYMVKAASVPREQARELIKRIREGSRNTDRSNSASKPTHSSADYELKIRARAYQLWEEAGRPLGQELDHWIAAENEFARTPGSRHHALSGFDPSSNQGNPKGAHRGRKSKSDEPQGWEPSSDMPSSQETANPPAGLPLVRPLSDN
jgi:hypothetical protein